MGLFKRGLSPHQTALAMIGARAGDRVFLAGRPDPAFVAELARVTGLNGQTLVATDADARGAIETAAATAGVLVEIADMAAASTTLPHANGTHDVVALHDDWVLLTDEARDRLVESAMTAVRSGGRVVVMNGRRRTGFLAARAETVSSEVVLSMLTRAGALAVRTLGSDDGVTYFEGRKSR